MARDFPTLYDDNYGAYECGPGDDPEEIVRFYKTVQRESRLKKCQGCGRRVRLRPEYALCGSCADLMERGGDF